MAPKDDGVGLSGSDDRRDFRSVALLFSVLTVLGFAVLAARAWQPSDFATYAMWAIACSIGGTAIGFLFGIPKVLQADSPSDEAGTQAPSYRQLINTNLTEISDWLTKIIVGLSLINLRRLPEIVNGAADLLVSSVNTPNQPNAHGFATAVIGSFSVIGFLFGYLSTRLFLASAFFRADLLAIRKAAKTDSRVDAHGVEIGVLKRKLFPDSETATTGAGQAVAPPPPRAKEGITNETEAMDRLLTLAKEYLAIPSTLPYGTRVRMKDDAADRMANLILETGDNRDAVVALADANRNDGVVVALATVVNLFPGPRDPARLLSVAPWVTRWHVQYRIVAAFGTLFRAQLLSPEETQAVVRILTDYRVKADASLADAIDSALTTIAQPSIERSQRQRV